MASLCGNIYLSRCLDHAEAKKVLVGLITMAAGDPQECLILTLTGLCCDRVDDSKWAIIAGGGIPHLVQMLETGSQKSREGAAHILWNLCCHGEDIRARVENAGAGNNLFCHNGRRYHNDSNDKMKRPFWSPRNTAAPPISNYFLF
ncbi:hypothetical protein Peur_010372 [Populus x canadensis]